MNYEVFQQWDMFTGEPVLIRSKTYQHPSQQLLLFSAQNMVEMSANARPWLNEAPSPVLELEIQDIRTDEEKERDTLREAQQNMTPMFSTPQSLPESPKPLVEDSHDLIEQSGEYTITLFQLGRDELTDARPDLKDRIISLKDTDIEAIALESEKAMQDIYKMVLSLTLASYLAKA